MAEVHLSYVDRNRTVEVRVGDVIVVALPENATTGYQWEVSSFAEDKLAFEGTDQTAAPPGALGAGGSQTAFRFRANSPNNAELVFKLWRGFESDESVFMFKVSLKVST